MSVVKKRLDTEEEDFTDLAMTMMSRHDWDMGDGSVHANPETAAEIIAAYKAANDGREPTAEELNRLVYLAAQQAKYSGGYESLSGLANDVVKNHVYMDLSNPGGSGDVLYDIPGADFFNQDTGEDNGNVAKSRDDEMRGSRYIIKNGYGNPGIDPDDYDGSAKARQKAIQEYNNFDFNKITVENYKKAKKIIEELVRTGADKKTIDKAKAKAQILRKKADKKVLKNASKGRNPAEFTNFKINYDKILSGNGTFMIISSDSSPFFQDKKLGVDAIINLGDNPEETKKLLLALRELDNYPANVITSTHSRRGTSISTYKGNEIPIEDLTKYIDFTKIPKNGKIIFGHCGGKLGLSELENNIEEQFKKKYGKDWKKNMAGLTFYSRDHTAGIYGKIGKKEALGFLKQYVSSNKQKYWYKTVAQEDGSFKDYKIELPAYKKLREYFNNLKKEGKVNINELKKEGAEYETNKELIKSNNQIIQEKTIKLNKVLKALESEKDKKKIEALENKKKY